ncbi:MAG TPA: retropepsin-like aspartic protease [Roseiflexaceae bacterium]|nr:retropepsin-like aspartic protease [Roseiflexaceae bacterium]HMP40483.1 retropepsin-like aspartic protease [Roseiflexaceae bacterium]
MVDDRTTLEFPSSGTTMVPLCAPDGLVCCMAAAPGGHPLRVLLDTGTDPSAIDARLARRLALPTGGSGLGSSASTDDVAFTEAELPWLKIGDLTIRDLFAPALDLASLPFGVDIVLGYNVLRQMALRIDYAHRMLTFAHPDLGLGQPDAVQIALDFFEHFPALPDLEADGVSLPLATIDTGSNAALTVGPDLARQLGLSATAEGVVSAVGTGFGGTARVLRREGCSVRLAGMLLDAVAIDTHLGAAGDLGRHGRANIGNRLLARFESVTLDYERRLLLLTPAPLRESSA